MKPKINRNFTDDLVQWCFYDDDSEALNGKNNESC